MAGANALVVVTEASLAVTAAEAAWTVDVTQAKALVVATEAKALVVCVVEATTLVVVVVEATTFVVVEVEAVAMVVVVAEVLVLVVTEATALVTVVVEAAPSMDRAMAGRMALAMALSEANDDLVLQNRRRPGQCQTSSYRVPGFPRPPCDRLEPQRSRSRTHTQRHLHNGLRAKHVALGMRALLLCCAGILVP